MHSKATFEEFVKSQRPDWEKRAEKELKGKPLASLEMEVGSSHISPVAFIAEQVSPWAEASSSLKPPRQFGGWGQRVDIHTDNLVEAKQLLLEALSQGANAIGFDCKFHNEKDFESLFKDVQIEIVDIHFYGENSGVEVIKSFVDYVNSNNLKNSNIRGSVEWNFSDLLSTWKRASQSLNNKGFVHFKTSSLDLTAWQNEGGNVTGELGFALSQLHSVLVEGLDSGVPIDQLTASMAVRLSVGQEYLLEISKFRALRLLWKSIVEQYEPEHACSTVIQIDACSSTWNYTARDERSNHLRATTAAMSALIGGVDGLCIVPHSATYRKPASSHRRLALNIHHLLKYESYLDQVDDPARGSYLIEKMTVEIADQAWKLFQESEELTDEDRQAFWKEKLDIDRHGQSDKKLLGVNLHKGVLPEQFEDFIKSSWESVYGKEVGNA